MASFEMNSRFERARVTASVVGGNCRGRVAHLVGQCGLQDCGEARGQNLTICSTEAWWCGLGVREVSRAASCARVVPDRVRSGPIEDLNRKSSIADSSIINESSNCRSADLNASMRLLAFLEPHGQPLRQSGLHDLPARPACRRPCGAGGSCPCRDRSGRRPRADRRRAAGPTEPTLMSAGPLAGRRIVLGQSAPVGPDRRPWRRPPAGACGRTGRCGADAASMARAASPRRRRSGPRRTARRDRSRAVVDERRAPWAAPRGRQLVAGADGLARPLDRATRHVVEERRGSRPAATLS